MSQIYAIFYDCAYGWLHIYNYIVVQCLLVQNKWIAVDSGDRATHIKESFVQQLLITICNTYQLILALYLPVLFPSSVTCMAAETLLSASQIVLGKTVIKNCQLGLGSILSDIDVPQIKDIEFLYSS